MCINTHLQLQHKDLSETATHSKTVDGCAHKWLFKGSVPISQHSPASAAEAASWTGTAVRSFEAELEAFAPGAPEAQEVPEGPRAACGAAKGTWRSPDRRSSP